MRERFDSIQARNRRIVELAQSGLQPALIERKVEVSREVVYTVLRAARDAGARIPHFSKGRPLATSEVTNSVVRFSLDRDLFDRLAPEAGKRGVNVLTLAQRLLEAIVADDLFSAVLDDEGGAR